MDSPRRRALLGLAAGTATTLAAGCLSTGDEPTDSTTPTEDKPATSATSNAAGELTASVGGELDYATWFPVPESLDVTGYYTYFGDLEAVHSVGVSDEAIDRLREIFVHVPSDVLEYDAIRQFASLGRRATVCTFDGEGREIQERLEERASEVNPTRTVEPTATEGGKGTDAGDDEATSRSADGSTSADGSGVAPEGYLGFRFQSGLLYLGADHLVWGDIPDLADALVEAHAGERERYASNADFAAVLDAAGDVDLGSARASSQMYVSSSTAFSYAWTFSNPIAMTTTFAFENASSTDASAVAELAEQAGFAVYDDVSTSTDGRLVSLTGTIPPSEFDLLKQNDGGSTETPNEDSPPQVSIGFEFQQGKDGEWDGDEEERVKLTHQGGDSIEIEQLRITYDGTPVSETARVDQTKPAGSEWRAGGVWTLLDATTNATFESGALVNVVWESSTDDRSWVIAEAVLP